MPIFDRVKEENMDEYIDENIENIKFESLTPKILDENNPIYTKALDFAFENDSIKNIAITGVYGSGKSTIWNTYVKEKNLKNIITVSLGKYEDECGEFKYNNDGRVENISCSPEVDNDKENRIERQIINQIVSQIDSKKISKSKYKFKSDKGDFRETIPIFIVLVIILVLINWDKVVSIFSTIKWDKVVLILDLKRWNKFDDFKEIILLSIVVIPFLVSIFFIILGLKKKNIFNISKINFKLVEAQLDEKIPTDETVIDKDMKEIVYLLYNSGTEVVVFEDLDRYDNIEIYNKLRELNFLANGYVNSNGKKKRTKRIIKFIYMVKDGLFASKDRTKFYDYIIPVVPIIDSRTSENYLISLLIKDKEENKKNPNELQANILANISLYIDDMRLLKNIVNEYYVYLNVLPMKELNLNKNKLFGMMVLKNVFPDEFELLQGDRGYILSIFDRIEKNIIESCKEIDKSIELKMNKINSINEYFDENGEYKNDDKEKIKKLQAEMTSLDWKKNKLRNNTYKEKINSFNQDKQNEIFSDTKDIIAKKNYFRLVRFLILEGLIDETYYYYRAHFDSKVEGLLKSKDRIFLKDLYSGISLDIFLDVETPGEIINRLNTVDYRRENILNRNILKYLLENDENEIIELILETVKKYKKYSDLKEILNTFDYENIKKIMELLFKYGQYTTGLKMIEDYSKNSMVNKYILKAIVLNRKLAESKELKLFQSHIEKNQDIISIINENEFDIFIDNMSKLGFKFENLKNLQLSKEKLIKIENNKLYILKISNVRYLIQELLDENVEYGQMIGKIYSLDKLKSMKEYIEKNFNAFIIRYINYNIRKEEYNNSEEILIKILISGIDDSYKLEYLSKNVINISKLEGINKVIENKEIIDKVLSENILEFNEENILFYCSKISEYSEEFIKYLSRNINFKNREKILGENKDLCNKLINNSNIDNKLFNNIIKYVDEQISCIDERYKDKDKRTRVKQIIENNLLEINEENIEFLVQNGFNYEILILIENSEEKEQYYIAYYVLKNDFDETLYYLILNSDILFESVKLLIDYIERHGGGVKIEKINFEKKEIIKYIIENYLSNDNKEYIWRNFEKFNFKKEFIEKLEKEGKLINLSNDILIEPILLYILENDNVSLNTKIKLIITKIENNSDVEELKKYISKVTEISRIASVFDKKYPSINGINYWEREIINFLINYYYVKKRADCRIMLIKKKLKK